MSAAGDEHHNHVIARGEVLDAWPDLLDDARRLVPERHRQWPRSPLMTERSEWQSPAAAIFTSTSPWPGGWRVNSVMTSGLESA
jgi:hypothetical protein